MRKNLTLKNRKICFKQIELFLDYKNFIFNEKCSDISDFHLELCSVTQVAWVTPDTLLKHEAKNI